MAATPPLQTTLRTPPTPLHGAKYDDLRPRSTRKSTRQSSSLPRRAVATPPPHSNELTKYSLYSKKSKSSSLRSSNHTFSPPSSTQTSPRTRGKGVTLKGSRAADTMDQHTSHEPFLDPAKHPSLQQPTINAAAGMLPTPAKTPRKKSVAPAAVNAAARVLFPARPDSIEDAMPTPRKRKPKRHVGFSLYRSMEDEDQAPEDKIEIYTDSKDKVPELDASEDNPFYEQPVQHPPPPEPTKSRKRKASHNIDNDEVHQAFKRDEGMVYVFRGKKIFRKFPNEDTDDDPVSASDPETSTVRPLTRSSIKPRLLFPTAKQRQEREAAAVEDEEATTDLEEPHDHDMTGAEEAQPTTPVKPTSFSPATPPTTDHATRAYTKKAKLEHLPLEPPELVEAMPSRPRGKKVSPFDGWLRTKSGSGGVVKGKKRVAEALEQGEVAGGGKRAKATEEF